MTTHSTYRGTGQTTKQLQALPQGGIFVVSHMREVGYTRDLCHKLGRMDIKLMTTQDFFHAERWRGLLKGTFDLDHHAETLLTRHDRDLWYHIQRSSHP